MEAKNPSLPPERCIHTCFDDVLLATSSPPAATLRFRMFKLTHGCSNIKTAREIPTKCVVSHILLFPWILKTGTNITGNACSSLRNGSHMGTQLHYALRGRHCIYSLQQTHSCCQHRPFLCHFLPFLVSTSTCTSMAQLCCGASCMYMYMYSCINVMQAMITLPGLSFLMF